MRTRVLLSIKPEFAEKIFDGTKKYEFRRQLFRNRSVTSVVVYASSPVQKVIGEFEVDAVISLAPRRLWELTKEFSGISKQLFCEYFQGKHVGHAIKVKKAKRYRRPLDLTEAFDISHPPQSFAYIT